MKLPRPFLGLAIVGIIASGVWASVPQSSTVTTATENTPWQMLGKGNLEAVQIDGTWMLHAVPTTYIQLLGIQNKKFDLPTPTVYAPTQGLPVTTSPVQLPAASINLKTPTGHTLRVLQTDKYVFDATNDHSQVLADGRLVFADTEHENIWLVDKTGAVKPLLDTTGLSAAEKLADDYWKKGEMYGRVIWSSRPQVSSDGETVLFYSNRDTIKDKFFADNIYAVSVNNPRPRLVFNSKPYKQGIQLINAVGNTVVGYVGSTNTLLLHDLKKAKTTEVALNGYPTSLAPDERTLLYRKVEKQVVGRDFYLRDIKTGADRKVMMPDGYFFNQIGVWSPNGKRFAFYLNGFEKNDPSKRYRTNVKIGVLDTVTAKITTYAPPPNAGTLYPLGSISWLDNQQVVCYTTSDTSWALSID